MANSKNNRSDKNCRLLTCNQEVFISTLNVRTIRKQGKTEELAHLFNSTKQSILGVVDHKLVHSDEAIKTQELEKCTLITTSAWRNASGAASGGVGLLVNRGIEKTLTDIEPFNERILIAHFNGNPKTTVIVHYAPTEGSENSEDHYRNLANAVNSIPKHNVLLVVGDCNAHIGKDSANYTYHETTNRNGKLLLGLAEESNLIVTNTAFQK